MLRQPCLRGFYHRLDLLRHRHCPRPHWAAAIPAHAVEDVFVALVAEQAQMIVEIGAAGEFVAPEVELFCKAVGNALGALDFLPERHTDFIFAVLAEEFGLVGCLLLLGLYLFVILRGLYIASQAQDTFARLLAGSLILVFFVYLFVNVGMVTGMLPVVGVPLPLMSYGGTSLVTLMAGFGMLMSIHTHRKLLPT